MIKVVFCLPGKLFSNNFLESWTNLLLSCPQFNVIPILRWATSSNVYQVRNLCLMGQPHQGIDQKPFQSQIEYDYLMWIDSDSVFTPDQFSQLLTQMKTNPQLHILSGLYKREDQKTYASVGNWKSKYFEKHGQPKFLTPKDLKNQTELLKVNYTGMGFMLVRSGVFESMTYPWFQPLGIQGSRGLVGFTSEDAAFCLRAAEKGFITYVDPQIIVGHEKPIIL